MEKCCGTPKILNKKMSPSSASKSTLTPCFIESWATSECDVKVPEHSAYLYDQSLVLLAFLASGRPQYIKQAKRIANAMVLVQKKDRPFKDGRLRNAYLSGDPIGAHYDAVRLPGQLKKTQRFEKDEYAVSSDIGNFTGAS